MYWNKELFRINIGQKEFQIKLERLITVKENNSIRNHAFESKKGNDYTVRGEIKNDEFIIWRTNRKWNGIFYPIFKGKIRAINDSNILQIKTRFNPFAEIIVVLIAFGIGYGIITEIVIKSNNELKYVFRRGLVGIILFLIFQSVPLVSYYSLKQQTLKKLQDYFQLTKVKI